jgi:ferrochelatase
VVVAPVQFLADHLEVLYDVDVAAREQAERCGLRFTRLRSLNDDPGLAEALAAVARRTLG